jgi:dTDP-4-amino-4,6-dideoxygalactose transaminase
MSPPTEPTQAIPFCRPAIGREEEEAVLRVLRSGWLTTGEAAQAFEQEFATLAGVPFALAVCSATAGLHLALEAVGVRAGSWVATSPYTFAASAEVIRYLGAHPLFVDIEEDSCNLSPAQLDAALRLGGREVSAVLPVHIAGRLCAMGEILELAGAHGAAVVEDAAHCLPWPSPRGSAGTMGDAGVYSFYATKPITTGEGGMVVTRREELARRMRLMRLHGLDRDVWNRYTAPGASWYYEVLEPGFKYNLSDLAASIGLAQLRKAEVFLARRREIARLYTEGLSDLDFLSLPRDEAGHSWHLFMIRLDLQRLSVDRNRFAAALQEAGIGVSVHFIPLHLMPYYRKTYGFKPEDFPVAYRTYLRSISLPIYAGLAEQQVSRVIATVRALGRRFYRKSPR